MPPTTGGSCTDPFPGDFGFDGSDFGDYMDPEFHIAQNSNNFKGLMHKSNANMMAGGKGNQQMNMSKHFDMKFPCPCF
jgi:hypothetical protein